MLASLRLASLRLSTYYVYVVCELLNSQSAIPTPSLCAPSFLSYPIVSCPWRHFDGELGLTLRVTNVAEERPTVLLSIDSLHLFV